LPVAEVRVKDWDFCMAPFGKGTPQLTPATEPGAASPSQLRVMSLARAVTNNAATKREQHWLVVAAVYDRRW